MKLNPRQKRFIQEYLICLNATQAAKKAGYSERTARFIGQENLKKPHIQQAINEVLDELASAKTANIQEVLEFLTAGMRGETIEEVLILCGNGEQTIEKKQLSAKDRIRCAELLGKRYGLFTDKFEINGKVPVMIVGEDNLED